MDTKYCFGEKYFKGEIIFDIVMSFLISVMITAQISGKDSLVKWLLFLLVFIIIFMIFGRSIMLDYWMIEKTTIYYFSKSYPYKRLFLLFTFQKEKHLLTQIQFDEIKNARIVWKEIIRGRNGLPRPLCLFIITTNEDKEIELNLGLNLPGSIIAGEAMQYLLEHNIIISGLNKSLMDCLLDPNKRMYDYYMEQKKLGTIKH